MGTLIILIKLIAAHLIGDFIFQTDRMCRDKFSTKASTRWTSLVKHAMAQAILTYIFIAQWGNWIVPLAVGLSHFCIDGIKISLKGKGFKAFVIDQLFHYCVILLIWWLYYVYGSQSVDVSQYLFSLKTWFILTAFIAVLNPTSIFIKLFLEYENWTPEATAYNGLPNAGKWIGYMERILILVFILTENIEGVGFLLAAKSIFRFGELNKTKDRIVTEYVLIGTLTSFSIAILLGYAALYIPDIVNEQLLQR